MTQQQVPNVSIVDDDPAFCRWVATLAECVGYDVATFGNAAKFLAKTPKTGPGCLVLDFRLPDLSGLDLLAHLQKEQIILPTIFVTAHADVPLAVEAMKRGAMEFLAKPCRPAEMIDAIQGAIRTAEGSLDSHDQRVALDAIWSQLSSREQQVANLLGRGHSTKEVATLLDINLKTVEFHRTRAYRKLNVANVVQLARFCLQAESHKASLNPSASGGRYFVRHKFRNGSSEVKSLHGLLPAR